GGNGYPGRIQKRNAQGHWSILTPGGASALAADGAGNLYVVDQGDSRIWKRDAQGHWSVITTYGSALGQVASPEALAADTAGNLYIAEGDRWPSKPRIVKQDALGNWSVIAS